MKHILQRRRGFTLIEVMMTMGVLGMATSLSVPMYRQYMLRNDLEIGTQNIAQGIERAKYLSQVAMNDSSWGFSTDSLPGRGVLFMGDSYATRNPLFDELYSLPQTLTVSGLTEVSFQKVSGTPSQNGTITLLSESGEQRSVSVTLGNDGELSAPAEWLTICINPYTNPETIQVPDSLWTYYSTQGALVGECGSGTTGGTTTGGTTGGTATGGSTGGSTGGTDLDEEDSEIAVPTDYTCTFTVLGANLNTAGYQMKMTFRNKKTSGSWNEPFGDWDQPVTGNINTGYSMTGPCADNFTSADRMRVRVKSWEKKKSWYDGTQNSHWKKFVEVKDIGRDDSVAIYFNGSDLPSYSSFSGISTIQTYVQPYVNMTTRKFVMASNQALILYELGTKHPSASSDFQDLAILMTFAED